MLILTSFFKNINARWIKYIMDNKPWKANAISTSKLPLWFLIKSLSK